MAKITYLGESDSIEWHGQPFRQGEPVTTDNATLIAAAGRHPLFEVSGTKAKAEKPEAPEGDSTDKLDAVKAKGAKAKADGKPRTVPPAYRGKPEQAAWEAGYDADPPAGDGE